MDLSGTLAAAEDAVEQAHALAMRSDGLNGIGGQFDARVGLRLGLALAPHHRARRPAGLLRHCRTRTHCAFKKNYILFINILQGKIEKKGRRFARIVSITSRHK
jgi:hypothetical protein